jgi:small subunit ribosomal protein S14
MAKTSHIVRQQRLEKNILIKKQQGFVVKNSTKYYNRCKLCWNSRSYMRDYGICRWCFIKYARLWLIAGVKKASR